MEIFSALLDLCAGNSPVTSEFPSQKPVTRSFDVFFDICLNKCLSKQSIRWWFKTQSRSSWRHCNGMAKARRYLVYVIHRMSSRKLMRSLTKGTDYKKLNVVASTTALTWNLMEVSVHAFFASFFACTIKIKVYQYSDIVSLYCRHYVYLLYLCWINIVRVWVWVWDRGRRLF